METFRLPRFIRTPICGPIRLTERDRDIIRLISRHRFLRSPQIIALIGGSSQQILRRLRLLYHHGYLERPRAQINYYHQGGNRSLVYGLGNKGGICILRELGQPPSKVSWGEKNRAVGRIFLEHALLVSDVMVALELACRKTESVRLLTEEQIMQQVKASGTHHRFEWKVILHGGTKLGVIPDRVFALECSNEHGVTNRAYFFLEADRGTMPVKRHRLSQTSFYRKLLAYEATWSQSIHQKQFGFNRFRVLTVTKSAARVNSLVEACSKLKRGQGLFLFADRSILEKPEEMFSSIWKTGRPGESVSLLS